MIRSTTLVAAGIALVAGLAVADGGAEPPADPLRAVAGKALFDKLWVAAPSSTLVSDGLGPLYSARSCAACHPGGGAAPDGDPSIGLVLRLSVATAEGPAPHPVYGRVLQVRGIAGQRAEGTLALDYEGSASGAPLAELTRPVPRIVDPGYGPVGAAMTSLRIAPPLFGLGAVEAIPDDAIAAAADPDDANGDGVSGRAARDGSGRLTRFGWKATMPDLRHQAAEAFADDIGLSTTLLPENAGDCTAAQAACRAAPAGAAAGEVEVTDQMLDLVVAYLRALRPPAAATPPPDGLALFEATGCGLCHRPDLHAGDATPYSDFLLHDMGEALADGRPDGAASGREWRTAPLWGMGRRGAGGAPASFLHDGRARTPLEAILWHDGEARAMRDKVIGMTDTDRARLLDFLGSL